MPRNAMRRMKRIRNRRNDALETSLEPIVKQEDAIDERKRSRILYIIIIIIIIVNFRVLNENVRTISRDTDFSCTFRLDTSHLRSVCFRLGRYQCQ